MRACSVRSTMTAPRRLRFAFVVFLRIKWRILARLRLTFPVPVTLNRFLALEWVFIFGMTEMISVEKWSAKVAVLPKAKNETLNFFLLFWSAATARLFGRKDHAHALAL